MHSMDIVHPQYEPQEGGDEAFAKHLEILKTSYCNMYTTCSKNFVNHVHGHLSLWAWISTWDLHIVHKAQHKGYNGRAMSS